MTSGAIALRPMLERGYDRRMALGVIMGGGALGDFDSTKYSPMIMFAAATQNSVGRMFLGRIDSGIADSGLPYYLYSHQL